MPKQKNKYPECVVSLADRFRLEAADVDRVVRGREQASIQNTRAEAVQFTFGDNTLNLFKVSCGQERMDYQFVDRDDFEPFYPPGSWF